MARVMRYDSTDIYRMVVDEKTPNGSTFQVIYGPHSQSNQARNHDIWRAKNPRRLRKQSLRPDENCQLYWDDLRTTYDNGGEDVNWDD